ncbi:MAG: galactokinase, partial [Gaiellaceae bacterium]
DLLVELAYAHGAVAARMTGGGFGGSVVALAVADQATQLVTDVADAYVSRSGRRATGFICASADGAGEVEVERHVAQ